MNNDEKAEVLDYMVNHAKTLLDGEVKDIGNYSPESIILAKHDASQFLKSFEEAKKRLDTQ